VQAVRPAWPNDWCCAPQGWTGPALCMARNCEGFLRIKGPGIEQFGGAELRSQASRPSQLLGILVRAPAAAPGAEAQKPSSFLPCSSLGPSSPFGERSTIIGQAGRTASPATAGLLADRQDLADGPYPSCAGHRPGASPRAHFPSTNSGSAVAPHQTAPAPGGRSAPSRLGSWDLVAVQVQHGRTAAVVIGLRNC